MPFVDVPLEKLKIYPDFGHENLPDSEDMIITLMQKL